MIKTQLQLDSFKKLVDLNGDLVNFEVNYVVRSQINEKTQLPYEFDLLVVNQKTLDDTPSIEYKNIVTGEQSGRVLHNKGGAHQTYYLILKAKEQCVVDIEIMKKEIPEDPQVQQARQVSQAQQVSQAHQVPQNPLGSSSTNYSKTIFIVIGIVVIAFALYWLFKKPILEQSNSINSGINSGINPAKVGFKNPYSIAEQLKKLKLQ